MRRRLRREFQGDRVRNWRHVVMVLWCENPRAGGSVASLASAVGEAEIVDVMTAGS
jgi:hypothetical protein